LGAREGKCVKKPYPCAAEDVHYRTVTFNMAEQSTAVQQAPSHRRGWHMKVFTYRDRADCSFHTGLIVIVSIKLLSDVSTAIDFTYYIGF